MKQILKIFILTGTLLVSPVVPKKAGAQVSASVSFQLFYDELSPYGRWIDYPRYGYVWCPNASYYGFHPYRSDGHWAWSDEYGWIWVSDYDWGWATFHYGRWFYDPFYGWTWAPEYEWAPAWVVWRSGGGYYGWAPMSPGVNVSFYFSNYSPPADYWCFVPQQYIVSTHISNYYVGPQQNTRIINDTRVINSYSRGNNNAYVTGPSRREAEGVSHQRIQPVSIRETRNPGRMRDRNNEIAVYKPEISRGKSGDNAPRKFERYNPERKNMDLQNRRDDQPVRPQRRKNNSEIQPGRDNNNNNMERPGRRSETKPERKNNPPDLQRQNDNKPGGMPEERRIKDQTQERTRRNDNPANRTDNPYRPDRNNNNATPNREPRSGMDRGGRQPEPQQMRDPSRQQPGNNNGNNNEPRKKGKNDG